MVLYYQKDAKTIQKSIIWGSLIAFIVYTSGLPQCKETEFRSEFIAINSAEDNVQAMINTLSSYVTIDVLKQLIYFFTYVAIISSFLGASLGLFDYYRLI